MEYPTVNATKTDSEYPYWRKKGCVEFVDDNHIVQFSVDEGMSIYPEQTMKEIQTTMDCVDTAPTEEFHFYLGCSPRNSPNYGSIHLYHEKDAEHLIVHSTNSAFSLCAKMTYTPSVIKLLLSSLYDMVQNKEDRERPLVKIHAEHGRI